MRKAELADNIVYVCGRAMHRNKAAIANIAAQIVDEIFVQVDDQQGRVGAHAVQHRLAECANARPIFNEQLCIVPIHRCEHFFDGLG